MVHSTNDLHASDDFFSLKKIQRKNKPDNESKKASVSEEVNAVFLLRKDTNPEQNV